MICPYCGKEIEIPQREHFFPQSLEQNDWDFWVCKKCNHIKREHIVFPHPMLFKKFPPDYNTDKFKRLWQAATMEKYLSIVPWKLMRQSFDEGHWVYGSKIFTVEERTLYKLDRFKEIYDWATRLISDDVNIQALIMSYSKSRLYLVHTYTTPIRVRYSEVMPVTVYDYVRAHFPGALILGSAKYGVWNTTSSYKEYFAELLGAPSTFELIKGGYV